MANNHEGRTARFGDAGGHYPLRSVLSSFPTKRFTLRGIDAPRSTLMMKDAVSKKARCDHTEQVDQGAWEMTRSSAATMVSVSDLSRLQ